MMSMPKASLSTLYPTRKALDMRRQSKICSLYKQLEADSTHWTPLDHPYNFGFDPWLQFLKRNRHILEEALEKSPPAQPLSPDGHLYRLTSVGSLLNLHNEGSLTFDASIFSAKPEDLHKNIVTEWQKQFNGEPDRNKDWLPLAFLANGNGVVTDYCQFTWWTDYIIPPDEIILAKNRLGLHASNVREPRLVLRCPVDAVKPQTLVPTSVAAFTNEVFLPVPWNNTASPPQSGRAICLANHPNLDEGENEFILREISVKHIEIWPVQRLSNKSNLNDIPRDGHLWAALNAFFASLP